MENKTKKLINTLELVRATRLSVAEIDALCLKRKIPFLTIRNKRYFYLPAVEDSLVKAAAEGGRHE